MYISAKKDEDRESLWRRFASGDKSVFGRLYTHYHRSLTAYCIGRIGNIEHAENVASEVLIKLLQYEKANEIENFEGWLFQVAKNECITFITKTARRKKLLNSNYKPELNRLPDVEIRFSMENIDHLIRTSLDEKDYKIWQLHQQGYDNREIAEIIDSSEKTVANRKSAARNKLKSVFKKLNE
ncbi:RNA polymerase sigma factor, sigma-70 family [Ekhidna lutea]|uniref:RNA polymerase sigma factor SigS n=1 Tax=Ekhidna lutea TaxID=447679 RepID=A0A239LME3_EKHLU|nr:RNA polymerase sigma factor [Ekhidna lutea]SNT31746.1 RNA polymerase sigma factor, sigma-70 family [Ekhidna lutea]